jgi:hypothetical protein
MPVAGAAERQLNTSTRKTKKRVLREYYGREEIDYTDLRRFDDNIDEFLVPEIPVDMYRVAEVEFLCKNNDTIVAAVDFLLNYLRAGGLTVVLELFGQKAKLNPELQEVFDVEWSQVFLEELVWDMLLMGVSVVNLVPSNIKKGEFVPMCIPRSCYSLTFLEYFDKRREYRVYPMRPGLAAGLYKKDGAALGDLLPKTYNRDEFVSVYVFKPPLSDGSITSVLNTLITKLQTSFWSWMNFGATDFRAAHPGMPVENVVSDAKQPDVNEELECGENTIGLFSEKVVAKADAFARHRLDTHTKAALALFKAQSDKHDQEIKQLCGNQGYQTNPHSKQPPWGTPFPLPSNMRAGTAPPVVYNPHMSELDQMLATAIARALNIPAQFFVSDIAMHAANATLAGQAFNNTIQGYHKLLIPVLGDLYKKSYGQSHEKFKKAIAEVITNPPAEYDAKQGAHHGDRYIKASGRPDHGPLAESSKSEASQRVEVSKLLGSNVNKKPGLGASKPAQSISDEDLEKLISLGIRFKISFKNAPLTTIDDLQRAWQELNIIDYTQFAERAAGILGIDLSCILSEEQHNLQMEKNVKQSDEFANKYPSGIQQGASGNGAGAKPKPPGDAAKKKSSSGSSSSNKKPKRSGE